MLKYLKLNKLPIKIMIKDIKTYLHFQILVKHILEKKKK